MNHETQRRSAKNWMEKKSTTTDHTMATATPEGTGSDAAGLEENEHENEAAGDSENTTNSGSEDSPQPPVVVEDMQYLRVRGFLEEDRQFPDSSRFGKFRQDEKVFMFAGCTLLKKVVGETRWKRHCQEIPVCDWLHVSDEAFLALLIENNEKLWNYLARDK